MDYKEAIDKKRLPKHVAIIMDGNGRWARKKGKLRVFGHSKGVRAVRESLEAAGEIGVRYLTLYAFSTENWNRPKNEVDALMNLLVRTISKELKELNEKKVRLNTIGDIDALPRSCKKALLNAIEDTKDNDRVTLTLALSYSSRWEMVQAVRSISEQVKADKITSEEINEKTIDSFLTTHNIPDPELLIRTSGEQRISNFLLWQIAYTELYFSSKLWPDFRKEDFYQAIVDYQNRERRFGKVSEQVQSELEETSKSDSNA